MDLRLYHWLNALAAQHGWLGDASVDWMNVGPTVLVLMVVGAWVLLPGDGNRAYPRRTAALAIAAVLLGLGIAQLIGHTWFRVRPYEAHPEQVVRLLVARSTDPSFPSDHAVGGFALAVPFLLERRTRAWGAALLVGAVTLAVGRVLVGIHYPTDVLAGALLGSAAALLVVELARLVDRRLPALWTPLRGVSRLMDGARSLVLRRAAKT